MPIDESNFDSLSDRQKLDLFIQQREQIEGLRASKIVWQESGTFTRKVTKHGKSSKTKTEREYSGRNPEKVVLGYWGNIEFFCYPFTSTDLIRVRIGKVTTALDKYQINKGIAIFNILRWAVNGGLESAIRGESSSKKTKEIQDAYNSAFKSMKESKPKNRKAKKLVDKLQDIAKDK